MSRQITIDPVTRIEGHAKVDLEIDDNGEVRGAVFKVMDFRGFETFLRGMQVEMMPTLTARICGTCPQTHHLAASKAVDRVFGAEIPRTAELLRQALNLGAMVHSHAVHFFALAGPDLIFGLASDPAERNIVGMARKHPELSKKALRLRTIGQKIVELVGGRGTHPVSSIPGGMAAPLGSEKAEKLKKLVAEGAALSRNLYQAAEKLLNANSQVLQSLPLETAYLGTVNGGGLDFYEGELRLVKPDGSSLDFPETEWSAYLYEKAVRESYGKPVYFRDGSEEIVYRVGPLARLNCAETIDTPSANACLEKFRETWGHPCHQTVLYHQARMIEILYAMEKLEQIIAEDALYGDEVRAELGPPRDAAAHVEAPRGVLVHDYKVDGNAVVQNANLLIATQQNLHAINETIGLSAGRYMDQPEEAFLNAIEFGIRCYDPCLSCATHRIGGMKLDVTVRRGGEVYRRARR
jgi:F420-non-reducing hydrogenase large subunit